MGFAQSLFILWLLLAGAASAQSPQTYFPERFDWQRRTAQQSGIDAAALDEALRFVAAHDNPAPRDQALSWAQSFGAKEPHFGGLIGPTKPRAAINGLVVYRGYVVAEWGDTNSVDMVHSVAKTFFDHGGRAGLAAGADPRCQGQGGGLYAARC